MFSSSVMLKMLPWGIAAVMALAAAACLHLYQSERDAFVAYRAEVTAIGKAQEAQIKKEKEQAEYNLKQVRKDYEDRVPDIRRMLLLLTGCATHNPVAVQCPEMAPVSRWMMEPSKNPGS